MSTRVRSEVDPGSTHGRWSIRIDLRLIRDRSGIDPGSTPQPAVDLGSTGYRTGSIWDRPTVYPSSSRIDQRSIRDRHLVSDRRRSIQVGPGTLWDRPGIGKLSILDRCGFVLGSTHSRRSIRGRPGIDPARCGIDPVLNRGRPRLTRGRHSSRQSTWDRQGIDTGSTRDWPGADPTGSTRNRSWIDPRSSGSRRPIHDRPRIDRGSISVRPGSIHGRSRIASIMDRPPVADRPRVGPGSTPDRPRAAPDRY